MFPDQICYPAAYYQGHAYFFERSTTPAPSRFGGPCDIRFSGIAHGPRPLHHILTLGLDELPGLGEAGITSLSLVYGLCFDGCSLTYEIRDPASYHLSRIVPRKSSDDWPYAGYPESLPSVPLRLAQCVPCSSERFSEFLRQNDKIDTGELVAVVPPVPDLGMSLWGDDGDAEGVQIVFRYDPRARKVRAYNECD